MLKDGQLIGTIVIYRQEVRPFSDKQIELVSNFATQAVIAFENARLLDELRQRTDNLSEALEQQTATSEVLQVISSSPGELAPVFEIILENATRICEAKFGNLLLYDGEAFRNVAFHNTAPEFADQTRDDPIVPPTDAPLGRLVQTKQPVHVADMRTELAYKSRFPSIVALVERAGARSLINVPMLKESQLLGSLSVYRQEVRPFTDKQIELLKNFAKQAVIAIENTRLLSQLRESLDRQTATSEVLEVISSTPGALPPVFEKMLENATRICGAKFANLLLHEDGIFRRAVTYGAGREWLVQAGQAFRLGPSNPLNRLVSTKQAVQIADMAAEQA
jgi:GAF domain-containing protein